MKTTVDVFLISIAGILLASCGKPSPLQTNQMTQVKQLMTTAGRMEWFSGTARTAIHSKDEREELIQQIQNQMPSLPGHTSFRCWVEKEATSGEDVLVGLWFTGLSGTGLMVGSTNFVPSAVARPRHRFEKLTNGVYVFYTFN